MTVKTKFNILNEYSGMIYRLISSSIKKQVWYFALLNSVILFFICVCFYLNFSFQAKKEKKIVQTQKIYFLNKMTSEVKDRLSFLEKTIPISNEKDICGIIKNIKSSLGVTSDVLILKNNKKHSCLGQVAQNKLYDQYEKEGVFRDSFENLCFAVKRNKEFYVIRISLSSLANALGLKDYSDISVEKKKRGSNSFQIAKESWLVLKENKESFYKKFIETYRYRIILTEITIFILLMLYFVLYFRILIVVRKENKKSFEKIKSDLKKLEEENKKLRCNKRRNEEISDAYQNRQDAQEDIVQKLREHRTETYAAIYELVSRLSANKISFYEKEELSKLQRNLLKKIKLTAHGLFLPSFEEISLTKIIADVEKYINWNLLKSDVSFSHNLKSEIIIQNDELGLKLLFINILVWLIGYTYKGQKITFNLYHDDQRTDIFIISSGNPISKKSKLNREDASSPLIFAEEELTFFSKVFGFSLKKINIDGFGYELNVINKENKLSNVVPIFR